MDIQKHAFRSPEEPRVVLDSFPLGRCVDNTEHFVKMVQQQLITRQHTRLQRASQSTQLCEPCLTLKYSTSFCSFIDVRKVFLARSSARAEYCSYARCACCSSV